MDVPKGNILMFFVKQAGHGAAGATQQRATGSTQSASNSSSSSSESESQSFAATQVMAGAAGAVHEAGSGRELVP